LAVIRVGADRTLPRVVLDGFSPVKSHPDAQCGGFYPGLPVVIDEAMSRTLSANELVQRLQRSGVAAASFPYSDDLPTRQVVGPGYRRAALFETEPQPVVEFRRPHPTDAAKERKSFLPLREFGGAWLVARTQATLFRAAASPGGV
jgi:hypothetical protein